MEELANIEYCLLDVGQWTCLLSPKGTSPNKSLEATVYRYKEPLNYTAPPLKKILDPRCNIDPRAARFGQWTCLMTPKKTSADKSL